MASVNSIAMFIIAMKRHVNAANYESASRQECLGRSSRNSNMS